MPTCSKCNKPVVKDIELCQVCNSAFHPGCSRCYILIRGARQCCVQAFSRSKSTKHIRSLSWPTNKLLALGKSPLDTILDPGASTVVTMSNSTEGITASSHGTLISSSNSTNLSNLPFSFNSLPPATLSSSQPATVFHSINPSVSQPNPPFSASVTGVPQFSPLVTGLQTPVSSLPSTSSSVNPAHFTSSLPSPASTNQRIEDFQKLSLEDRLLESY